MNKLFDLSKNYYCIVDTSYIVFYCAASAFKDYVYQEDVLDSKLGPNFDPTIDPEFNFIFAKKFKSKIESSIKTIIPFFFNSAKIIFSLDCPRKDIWRRQIFPEYKLTRDTSDHSKDKFNIGKVFAYAYSTVIPDFCNEVGGVTIKNPIAESDDVIAVLCKYILEKDKNNSIIILSSDRDMVQLYNDRVSIITCMNETRDPKKEIMALTKIKDLDCDITAADFLLFKILIGDGSDNIPSVKMRMGPKTAIKYVLDKSREELKKLLSEDVNIAKGFKRNKQLISMKEIPDYVTETIVENIDETFEKGFNKKEVITEKKIETSENIDDIIDELMN